MSHVHLHLHAKDAGTSEGARKAAITRKATMTTPQASLHRGMIENGYNHHGPLGGAPDKEDTQVYHNPRSDVRTHVHRSGAVNTRQGAGEPRLPIYEHAKRPTGDAGTSEGARKAAQTRKQHGGGSTLSQNIARASGREQQIRHHESQAAYHGKVVSTLKSIGGFNAEAKQYANAMNAHRAAAESHRSGSSEAPARSKIANTMSEKLGKTTAPRVIRDAGTSEGARKAAQTRKSGGGSNVSRPLIGPYSTGPKKKKPQIRTQYGLLPGRFR